MYVKHFPKMVSANWKLLFHEAHMQCVFLTHGHLLPYPPLSRESVCLPQYPEGGDLQTSAEMHPVASVHHLYLLNEVQELQGSWVNADEHNP